MKFARIKVYPCFVIAAVMLAACAPAAAPTPAPTAPPAVPATSASSAITPAVMVSDQDASGGSVKIDRVTAAEQGWIVIHTDQGGSPGPVIGHSAVQPGDNANVVVQLDLAKATPKLWAMLHVDKGVVGTYEFPGADSPVKDKSGAVVMMPLNVALPTATQPAASSTIAPTAAMTTGPAALKMVSNDKLGQFLADSSGRTVYVFLKDTADTSTCSGGCAQKWPALTTLGNPTAGDGVDASLLGMIAKADGSMQVTYNKHPLYYYVADVNPGDTNGQGVGDVWYVVSPQGSEVVK